VIETARDFLRNRLEQTGGLNPVLTWMLEEADRIEDEQSGHEYDAGYHAALLMTLEKIATAQGWEDVP